VVIDQRFDLWRAGSGGDDWTSDDAGVGVTYADWAERLCAHFFHEGRAGEPVTFFVDDELLGELDGSGDPTAGVENLRDAVRTRISPDSWGQRFARIDTESFAWKVQGAVGPPPALPLLAVAVLAGTHMAASTGISATNYWTRFRQLLDLPAKDDLRGRGEVFPELWKHLAWWLDEQNDAKRGRSTIDLEPYPSIIGFALSQSLFRESDRQHLSELFQRIGLTEGEEIDGRELLQYFKAWVPRSTLSRGAKLMASDANYDERLASILRDEADRFDGTLRDSAGRRIADLVILFEPFPAPTYRVAASRPDAFPERAAFRNGSLVVELSPLVEGWYAETWPLDARWLADGLKVEHGSFVLRLHQRDVIPFSRNRDFGCWSSVARIEPSEPHMLLVANERDDEVAAYLAEHALGGWKAESSAFAPEGWTLFANVVFERAPLSAPPGALEVLVPVLRERPTLKGGLALDTSLRIYLHGGEPDLWLPSLLAEETVIQIDGATIEASAGARVPLRELKLEPGVHEISVGLTQLSFQNVSSLKFNEAEGTGSVRHLLHAEGGAYLPVSVGATANESQWPDDAEVIACGAHLTGEELPDARHTVVLPLAADNYVLVGARCGEVMRVSKPERPKWLDDVSGKKLWPIGFEVYPEFDVVWEVRERLGRRIARLRSPIAPDGATQLLDEDCGAWRDLFRKGAEVADGDVALWDAYRDVAEGGEQSQEILRADEEQVYGGPDPTFDATDDVLFEVDDENAYELLLRWASEVGAGSWSAFRNAHDWLFNAGRAEAEQVKATTTIHALSMLGHVEIDWENSRWAAAPAAITILPTAGAHAVLAGSRTRRMAQRFIATAMADDSDLFADEHLQDWGPNAIFVAAGSDEDVEALGRQLGIHYEVCVSDRLAALLPDLGSYLQLGISTPGAKGYGVERFHAEFMLFRNCESDEQPGFYRYDVPGRPEMRFVADDGNYYRVDRALGVYSELRRLGKMVMQYEPDSVNGTLFVPFRAQLPALHARAAVLCCGLMPLLVRGTWMWAFRNVPRQTAERIAASLSQTIT
jgi:hypothetical protein